MQASSDTRRSITGRYVTARAVARLSALVMAAAVLASCTNGRAIGDVLPYWASGLPKDVPPRPGTPEYDALRQKMDAQAVIDKSKDDVKSKTSTEDKEEK